MPKGVFKRSAETKARMSISARARTTGRPKREAHAQWKGERAGYRAKHTWVAAEYGRPMMCETCGVLGKSRYHWANMSGEYHRIRSDWKRLCVSCHIKFDGSAKKGRQTYSFDGQTLRLEEWAQKIGVKKCTLSARLFRYGWPMERVFATGTRKYGAGARKQKRPALG